MILARWARFLAKVDVHRGGRLGEAPTDRQELGEEARSF